MCYILGILIFCKYSLDSGKIIVHSLVLTSWSHFELPVIQRLTSSKLKNRESRLIVRNSSLSFSRQEQSWIQFFGQWLYIVVCTNWSMKFLVISIITDRDNTEMNWILSFEFTSNDDYRCLSFRLFAMNNMALNYSTLG